ncbi:MAG: hypothetical protein AAB365_00620 [Patescibacteria group bacterium]
MWFLYIIQTLIFSYISFLLGRSLLKAICWRKEVLLHSTVSLILGYGAVAMVGLMLSLFGILNIFWLGLITIIILYISRKTIYYHVHLLAGFKSWKHTMKKLIPKTKVESVLLFILIAWTIIYTGIALSASAMGKDGLAYHLPFSAEIASGEPISFPIMEDPEYGQLPVLGEILYAVTIVLFDNLGVSKLIEFAAYLLLIIFAALLSHRYFTDKRFTYLTVILLLACMPLARNALSGGMIDIWSFLFSIASLLLLIDTLSRRHIAHEHLRTAYPGVILAGALLGLGLGIKYLSLFFGAIGLIEIILISRLHKEPAVHIAKVCGIYFLSALIIGGFWYIKNLILTGNPFFPIFAAGGGVEFTVEVNAFILNKTWYNFFIFPFYLFGKETYHLPFGIFLSVSFMATYALAIYLAFKRNLRGILLYTLVALEIYLAFVFIWSHQIRFIIPALILNNIFLVLALDVLMKSIADKGSIYISYAKKVVPHLLIVIALTLLGASIVSFKKEIVCATGLRDRNTCFREIEGGAIYVTDYINTHLKDEKVLEYWNVFYRYSMKNGNSYIDDFCSTNDDAAIRTCLQEMNVRYFIDDTKTRGNPWMRDEVAKLRTAQYFLDYGMKVYEYYDQKRDTHIRLYAIVP